MKLNSTIKVLNLLSKISKRTGRNKKELFKEICNKCQITYPENIELRIVASKDCENIKMGDKLVFDIFNQNLIENKIYYFTYERENIYYEDFGKYNKETNSFSIFDGYIKVDEHINILGQLAQIKSRELEMI